MLVGAESHCRTADRGAVGSKGIKLEVYRCCRRVYYRKPGVITDALGDMGIDGEARRRIRGSSLHDGKRGCRRVAVSNVAVNEAERRPNFNPTDSQRVRR